MRKSLGGKPLGAMKVKQVQFYYNNRAGTMGFNPCSEFTLERTCWDPKDGELCLNRSRPEETLVEDRSGFDVQINRRIWVQGRKTNRTIQQLVPTEVSPRIAETLYLVLSGKANDQRAWGCNSLDLFSNFESVRDGLCLIDFPCSI